MKNFLTFLVCTVMFNLSIFAQPNSVFTVDRYNICSGTELTLTNMSTGASSYEWKIQGIHYSYSEDTIAVLVEPCYSSREIELIASDASGQMSTSSISVEVFDTCFFHWVGEYADCVGDTVKIFGNNNEELAREYVLNPPHTLLSGCLTCPTIEFVLTEETTVDRTSVYIGGCSEVRSYHYLCENPNGVEELFVEKIKIFPNPASQNIFIETENKLEKIQIYNTLGQLVLTSKNLNDSKTEIDISDFQDGIYYFQIKFDSGKSLIRKVVIN